MIKKEMKTLNKIFFLKKSNYKRGLSCPVFEVVCLFLHIKHNHSQHKYIKGVFLSIVVGNLCKIITY